MREGVAHVLIERCFITEKQTMGRLILTIDDFLVFECITLELPWKDNKKNVSCVPTGFYEMVYEYSDKFKKNLWEIKDVKNRSECKIHVANYVTKLNGCIGLGKHKKDINGDNVIDLVESRRAVREFENKLKGFEKVKITIK